MRISGVADTFLEATMRNQVPLCLPNLKMSGCYIFKFEKVLLILGKVVMFFHFYQKRAFFLQKFCSS